jgi:N-acetylmuramoyl-L-alanine amidase
MLLQIGSCFAQNARPRKIIMIDPGHGGKDSGAIGINGILEKDVVLNISKEISKLNQTLFEGDFDIYLTRYKDTLIALRDRSKLTQNLKADLFISLHCNASSNSSRGIEMYVHNTNQEEVLLKKSIALGLCILEESTLKLGFEQRGVRFANFQVLRENGTFCPAVLLEMGFVTNADEAEYLLKLTNIRAMALTILMGMHNYLNNGL